VPGVGAYAGAVNNRTAPPRPTPLPLEGAGGHARCASPTHPTGEKL